MQELPQIDVAAPIEALASASFAQPTTTRPGTRLRHDISKPKVTTDDTVRYSLLANSCEPNNLHEALGDPKWKLVMDKELDAL
jgi:hypothetical protein